MTGGVSWEALKAINGAVAEAELLDLLEEALDALLLGAIGRVLGDVAVLEKGERVAERVYEPVLHAELPARDALVLDLDRDRHGIGERGPLAIHARQSQREDGRRSEIRSAPLRKDLQRCDAAQHVAMTEVASAVFDVLAWWSWFPAHAVSTRGSVRRSQARG